ncbi:MAG TPA: DJ-1/PfpI family protein [Pyrinomonadaceae bacterium]|jgi:putative intracellular protease/amidase|nr:DJ-1/PfpI family protein [Pyrinomonadaceae bacterium]
MSKKTPYPPTIRIGILIYEGFEPIDVWGFTEAFAIARFIGTDYQSKPPYPFEVLFIANEVRRRGERNAKPAPVKSQNGPRVAPDMFRDDALKEHFDLFMIPGGRTEKVLDPKHQKEVKALVDWVKAMDKRVPITTSVCTGAAVLAHAGVLDGQPAATNHAAFEWVVQFGPRVLWDNVSRWVDAGKYVTSAGVSAGTDMAFHLVDRLAGRAVAEAAAKQAEYDWHRDPQEPIYYPEQAPVPTSFSNS